MKGQLKLETSREWLVKLRTLSERFFFSSSSASPFVTLRVGLAAVLLVRALVEADVLLELYGNRGIMPWSLSEIRPIGWAPNMSEIAGLLSRLGVDQDRSLYLIFGVYLVSLLGLLMGVRTRLAACFAWLTHLLLFESTSFSSYGADSFINIALFYCTVMPVEATVPTLSIVARRRVAHSVTAGTLLRVMQIHLCIVYLSAGIEKAKGTQWWNGEAIWRSVMQPQFQTTDMSWLAWVPLISLLASWGTLVVEIGYPFLIWPRKTRPFFLAAVVLLHLSIALLLGLHLFAAVLIVLNLSAFGPSVLTSLRPKFARFPRALALAART